MTKAMHDGFIIWEPIKEARDGFYIEYLPPRSDMWLAHLTVTFLAPSAPATVTEILEKEFQYWARKFPIPLMASASDDTDTVLDLSSVRPYDHICGYYDPGADQLVMVRRGLKNGEFPDHLKQEGHLRMVYADLPARTEKQIKAEVAAHVQQTRRAKHVLLFLFFLWLLVIPAIIEFLGDKYTWFATLLLFFIFGKSTIKWLKMAGYIKQSEREIREADKQQKMRHYYYHCERNPEGFARLRAENFEREAKETTRKEMADLTGPKS
jgi:hypothetical protein